MPISLRLPKLDSLLLPLTCALCTIYGTAQVQATTLANIAIPPAAVAVQGPLSKAPAGVTDLKFQDMIKMPIGPKGLEPTARLLSLHQQRVRLVGYMASQEQSVPGILILSPMPVNLGDEDESLSDDLPGNAVFVHLSPRYADKATPNLQGLLQLTGTLSVGAQSEADGHVSSIRLTLDDATSRLLTTQAAPSKSDKATRKRVASAAH
jgi:hypothetical protein